MQYFRSIYHGCRSYGLCECFVRYSGQKYCKKKGKCAECFFDCASEWRGTRFHPRVQSTFSQLRFAARALWAGGSSRSGYSQRIRGPMYSPCILFISLYLSIYLSNNNNNNNNNCLQHPNNKGTKSLRAVLRTRLW